MDTGWATSFGRRLLLSVVDLSDRYYDTHDIYDDWDTNFGLFGDISTETGRVKQQLPELIARPR